MKTTRQHILDYIERKGAASAGEMAGAMHLTAANIRHHLEVLLSEGAIEVTGQRKDSVRGRPGSLYALKSKTSQHNLDKLASALLTDLLAGTPQEEQEGKLRRIASRMHASEGTPGGVLSARLLRAVDILNELKYAARWEARAEAPRVILGHCPYAAIIHEHPELCRMDAHLLEQLTGAKFEQKTKLELTPQGLRQCIFEME
jgi:predicted ArsR family transcriptional regulator